MEPSIGWWDQILAKDWMELVILPVIAAVVFAVLVWSWIRGGLLLTSLLSFGRRQLALPAAVASYRTRLDADTFRICHSWMREDQFLDDILVPVHVLTEAEEAAVDLQVVFHRVLAGASSRPVRAVLTGPPGSGKSVSVRIAARLAWTVGEPGSALPRYVPVLISFADLHARNHEVDRAIAESLLGRGFAARSADRSVIVSAFVEERRASGGLLLLVDGLDELAVAERPVAARGHDLAWAERRLSLRDELPYRPVPRGGGCPRPAARDADHDGRVPSPGCPPVGATVAVRCREERPGAAAYPGDPAAPPGAGAEPAHAHDFDVPVLAAEVPAPRQPGALEVCTRALLEEWDQSQNPGRANRFDRPHKEELLARMAHAHRTGSTPDADLDEHEVGLQFRRWLAEMGLNTSVNAQILREIVQNAGLLVRIPPSGLRFPHQTFLEYFAALFFHRYGTVEALRTEYARDPRGFREVVLLFCGLTESGAEVSALVDDTLGVGKVAMAVEVVANARRPPPEVVARVLGAARAAMEKEPTPELAENLGFIGRNQLSAFADQAWGILTAQVDGASDAIDPALLQALILAIARADREDGVQRVIDQFDRLQLARVLPAMTDNARGVLARAVVCGRAAPPPERMQAWIEGLRAAEMVPVLFETLFAAEDDAVRGWCGAALARLSRREDFWAFLDGGELPEVPSDPAFGREWWLWGWPRERPVGEAGKRWALWIALALAREM